MKKKVVAIIPAAGSGMRLGSKTAKPYLRLCGKPLLSYCLRIFEKSPLIHRIIVVAEQTQLPRARRILRTLRITKADSVIAGGATRSESVWNALQSIEPDTDFVLIHDGARPFVTALLVAQCVSAAERYGAAVCAVRCAAAIKSVNKNLEVVSTLDRDRLWQVQTPQVFSYALIMKAYRRFFSKTRVFFDDASLVERLPHTVKIVPGAYANIKITTAEDMRIARALLKGKR
jgi:2-C-methyl-D-erythritol 4-phosphate cytidylyltransferase